MRRAPIVLSATVLGTAAVLIYKPMTATGTTSSSTGSTALSPGSSSATQSGTSSSGASATPSPSSSANGTGSAKSTVVTGTAVTTRFGTTQVKVTITGGKITAVTAVQLNQDDPRSSSISEGAEPVLRSEVLSRQTAAVDTVSGATYTSLAYEASLQAALDKAGYTSPDGSKASTSTPVDEGGH